LQHLLSTQGRSTRPNLICLAQAGSGKTLAFLLAAMTSIDLNVQQPQAVIIAPTRELVLQIATVAKTLGQYLSKLEIGVVVKDVERGIMKQQLIVATPGSLLGKVKHRELSIDRIQLLTLDEADGLLLQHGLADQTMQFFNMLQTKKQRLQVLLFSATFPDSMEKFSAKIAPNAIRVKCQSTDNNSIVKHLSNLKQFYIKAVSEDQRYHSLTTLYSLLSIGQSIIFTNTIKTCQELTHRLRKDNFSVSMIHGGEMSTKQRDSILEDFRTGKTTVLVSSDLLSRGIDVVQVNLVVNYDIPKTRQNKGDVETFLHRCARAGRFDRPGIVFNYLCGPECVDRLSFITSQLKISMSELPTDLEAAEKLVRANI
jgi:ATP-dependent RNA helicase DDX19/DBP5